MTFTNVLGLTLGRDEKFQATFAGRSGGLEGVVRTIYDKRFDGGRSAEAIWDAIKDVDRVSDGITYVIGVINGGASLAYVGKTTQTLAKRYAGGRTGGLKAVFDYYQENIGTSFMECTLYNTSNAAFIEGWCYQLLHDHGIRLTNIQDPN